MAFFAILKYVKTSKTIKRKISVWVKTNKMGKTS